MGSRESRAPIWLAAVGSLYQRIAIVGGPGVGKTTLSRWFTDRPVIGTDDYQKMDWEKIPSALIEGTGGIGPAFVVEGVQVARALRKGLAVDAVIHLETPHRPDPLPGQLAMGKGVETVFAEWKSSPLAQHVPVYREDGARENHG